MKISTIPSMGGREIRKITHPIELRAATEGASGNTVFGYAAKFNSRSNNLGTDDCQFYEIILPGAFDDVLNDDVRALFNHEAELILARSKNGKGTLSIGVDDIGLWYQFDAPDTQAGRDLIISLRRGDIDQSSFSFTVGKDGQDWKETQTGDGPVILERTIKKVSRLYDVSPVTYPAYEETDCDSRSLQSFIKEFRGEPAAPPAELAPTPEQLSEAGDWAARIGLTD